MGFHPPSPFDRRAGDEGRGPGPGVVCHWLRQRFSWFRCCHPSPFRPPPSAFYSSFILAYDALSSDGRQGFGCLRSHFVTSSVRSHFVTASGPAGCLRSQFATGSPRPSSFVFPSPFRPPPSAFLRIHHTPCDVPHRIRHRPCDDPTDALTAHGVCGVRPPCATGSASAFVVFPNLPISVMIL